MKKNIIQIFIFSLLFISPVLAVQGTLEVDELREHIFLLLNFANSSYSNQGRTWFLANNPDNRQMFLSMQVIPIPNDYCYTNLTHCNLTNWDEILEVTYQNDRLTDKIILNTSSCWDWWVVPSIGAVGEDLHLFYKEENKTLCSLVSIPFTPEDDYFNISFNMSSTGSGEARPSYNVRVFDFSTAYTNRPVRYSTTATNSLLNIADLLEIQMNVTKLIYYSAIITLMVVGVLVFVGGIPILIKWIISKMVK